MAITSTRLCRAVCFCVVSFASGFLCFFLLFGCSLGGFVLPDAAWARSELAVFCFLALVVCLASLRPLKKSTVQKKKNPSSTITPPSSTITLTKKYQVFLSFRGEDSRVGITSHLDAALSGMCMVTFIDYKLVRGDEISTALLKSIQESMIAVIIFSKNYASSKWCLRELAEIMKREKLHELIVLPIFYNVDPSDVRKQTGHFKDSFAKHEKESPEEVQEWREAFTQASNLAGWDYDGTWSESQLVRDIVEDVRYKLMSEIQNISPPLNDLGLIGIENRIEPVMSLLCLGTMDVRIIGIWGMGGIGKTTFTEVVFNQISDQFDGSCFIAKVGERLENGETNDLQLEFLSKVLREENLQLVTPTILNPFIKQRLSQRKVLIVFDDVNNFLRLGGFVKGLRFGSGSRIIITSRDKHVLQNFSVLDSNIYEVPRLNFFEALMLFSNYAFNQNLPTEDFMDLSERMVYYANGNPLALTVLGSALLGMSKQEWESAVDDLQGIGYPDIFNVLKISYDRLSDKEKNLFLDIACFSNDYSEGYIIKLLDCKYSLRVLINKSLITKWYSRIYMHDLQKEMGTEIVRRESPKNPGKRSRLWKLDDVIWTLKNNAGTGAVEGIFLNMDHLEDDLILGSQVFDKMHNLRLLLFINNADSNKLRLPNGHLNSLPDELIILKWHRCPLKALPSNFSPQKLVEVDIWGGTIEQLWERTKHAPKLKRLRLDRCPRLTRIPNLSYSLLLEEVDLLDCESLVEFPLTSTSIKRLCLSGTSIEEVPSSIQSLTNLIKLDLYGNTRLKHISTGILKLKSLLTLHLDDCSKLETFLEISDCSELETFPEISETMEILNSQELSGTTVTDLRSSIEHMNGLQRLTLSECKNLEMLPSSICDLTSLEFLHLSNCTKLDKLPENLGNLKSLKQLLVERTAVGQLPSSIRYLENLEILDCSECRALTTLPPLSGLRSLSYLNLKKCNLMEIPEDIGCLSSLTCLDLCGNMFESLPKSIKHLSKLEFLLLRDCNMLRSLTELPVALLWLEAINCQQLCQALPDASEFKRCIHSKILFTNSFNLDHKAVINFFEESLKGSEEPPTQFSICLPGTEIPEWFTCQSSESSVIVQVLRQDLVNRKFMGFAICVVLEFEECHMALSEHSAQVHCTFETYDDEVRRPFKAYDDEVHRAIIPPPGQENISFHNPNFVVYDFGEELNSDHILLGYFSISKFLSSSQNLEKLPVSDSDYVDFPFEFKPQYYYKQVYVGLPFEFKPQNVYKVKYCAAHPIYAKPIKIIDPNIEDIEEISGKRSGRSDDIEEEVEPHSKRFCTQPKLMLPISNQNP